MTKYLVIFTIFITGCGVTNDEITYAQSACINHNGLRYMFGTYDRELDFICNDGAQYKIKYFRGRVK